jgi:hypothetical protein
MLSKNSWMANSLMYYQLWFAREFIGKLHNLMVDVRNVHKLHYGFQKAQ